MVPSQSNEDYKAHIILVCEGEAYSSDNPLKTKSGYAAQIDLFLAETGMNIDLIDSSPLYATSGYLAPASCGGNLTVDEANAKSRYHPGKRYKLENIEDHGIILSDTSQNKKSSYVKNLPQVEDEQFDLKDVKNSHINILKRGNTIYQYGQLVSIADVVAYILRADDRETTYGGFGCPICNEDHTEDPRTTPYSFAYLSHKGSDVLFKCSGNACSDKPLFILDTPMEDEVVIDISELRTTIEKLEDFTGACLAPVLEDIARVTNAIDRDGLIELTKSTAKDNSIILSKAPIRTEVDKYIAKHEKEKVEAGKAKEVDTLFNDNEVVWDPDMGVFCEMNSTYMNLYSKDNFKQTLSSLSGIPTGFTGTMVASIPAVRVVYKPDQHGGELSKNGMRAVNRYKAVIFTAKNEGVPTSIDNLFNNVFESDMPAKDVFINWLAYIVQYKKRTGIAWGFFGAQGTGKGLVCEVVKKLVGDTNASMQVGDDSLASNYNDYSMHKLFIQLDEITSDMHGRKGVAGKLKRMVSNSVIRINQKFIKEIEVDNYCNFILNSNKPNPIELDPDDRRWNMVYTRTKLDLCSWWDEGSWEKILDDTDALGSYLTDCKVDIQGATSPLATSAAKKSVINNTTPLGQLLATHIDACNYDELVEFCNYDENDIVNKTMIKWACDNKIFTSALISSMYRGANGDDPFGLSNTKAIKAVKPYFKYPDEYTIHRGVDDTGCRGRGYKVTVETYKT